MLLATWNGDRLLGSLIDQIKILAANKETRIRLDIDTY